MPDWRKGAAGALLTHGANDLDRALLLAHLLSAQGVEVKLAYAPLGEKVANAYVEQALGHPDAAARMLAATPKATARTPSGDAFDQKARQPTRRANLPAFSTPMQLPSRTPPPAGQPRSVRRLAALLLGITIAALTHAAGLPIVSAAPRESAGSQLALVDQQGRFLTWVDSVVGANDRLVVTEEQLNADRHFQLHSGGLAPEVLILRLPAVAPSPAVQNWLGLPTLGTAATWQTGAVVLVDGSGRIVEKYSFDGVLLGMILPGPDASKPGSLTPLTVFLTLGHGTRTRTPGGTLTGAAQPNRLTKLRYAVTGLDASQAEAGAPILISGNAGFDDARAAELQSNPTQTSADAIGAHRDANVTPLVVRPIHVTLALTQNGTVNAADAWRQWQNAQAQRAVRIDWLDASGTVGLSITSNMLPKTVDEAFGPAAARKTVIELVGEAPQFAATTAVSSGAFAFGQRYGFGNDNPGTVQVDGMEYSVERFPFFIGGSPYATVPTADQKLVIVHYHLRNDGSSVWSVDFNTLHLRVTDTEGKTFDGNGRIITDSDHRSVSASLAPGGELVASSAIVVDGRSVLKQLALAAADLEHPEIVYDLTQSTNPVKKLTAPFVVAGDTTGAVTLANIPIARGTTVPLGLFDATYTGSTLTKPSSADAGDAQWLARFTVRNRSLEEQTLTVGTLTATTETAESDKPMPIAPASAKVGAGESVNVEFSFNLQTAPKRLQLREGESRVYVINVAG